MSLTRASLSLVPREGEELIAEIEPEEFTLLERTVELVVQSQAFSRDGLRYALRLDEQTTDQLVDELQTLGVIDARDAPRVLVPVRSLALFLADLRAGRREPLVERLAS